MVLAEAAAAAYSTVELLILLLSSDTAAVVVYGTHGLPDVNLIGLFKRKKDISSVFPEKI